MIIKVATPYIQVDEFVVGLQNAAKALGRVADNTLKYWGTAWLITNDLLMAGSSFYFLPSLERDSRIETEEFYTTPSAREVLSAPYDDHALNQRMVPKVVRLRQGFTGQALKLAVKLPRLGEPIYLLHHPLGSLHLQLSIGTLRTLEGQRLQYDANTEPGSGGAPVLNQDLEVIGVHLGGMVTDNKSRLNEGLSLAGILAALRPTPAWSEIAAYHKLADLPPAIMVPATGEKLETAAASSQGLLRVAVLWSFDPSHFSQDEVKRLRSIVSDPVAKWWSLRSDERRRLLKSASSLDELRAARGDKPAEDTGQRVIDEILEGPPFELEKVDEEALPHWLQAVRWFAGIVPLLPTPKEVNRTLEKRRIRSRLRKITGQNFQGRVDELERLRAWYDDEHLGPITITGIGGVGKSALVSQFALGLPIETIILWLDFDRADIAPDDAASVLSLLSKQAALQIDGYSPPLFDEMSWQEGARAFGATLAAVNGFAPAALLVLDGFEIAQYVQQHQEIWRLLELILEQAPTLRVLVSGRVPVLNLTLGGRKAESLNLVGLSRLDVETWLRRIGLDDATLVDRVLVISRGVPLVIILAVRWLMAGGEIRELDEKPPIVLVEGFLYQRILDRVIDPSLKPVARDALVLRRLTVDLIIAVLSDSIPQNMTAQEVYDRLEREVALVGYDVPGLSASVDEVIGGVLHLRPEVRAATLRLLESDNAERVRAIDERAAAWYAEQDGAKVVNVAELVYHRLRLGDLAGADIVWRDECVPFLLFAEEDLPEEATEARAWLHERLSVADGAGSLESWERQALARIKDALGRELLRVIPSILAERPARSPASPLLLYDAWERWQADDLVGARALLQDANEIAGVVGRDRTVFAALLATEMGDLADADRLLSQLEDQALWSDQPDPVLTTLVVGAARVRLAVNLEAELRLAAALSQSPDLGHDIARYLPPADVLLPKLVRQLTESGSNTLESIDYHLPVGEIEIPFETEQLNAFRQRLDKARESQMPEPVEFIAHLKDDDAQAALHAFFQSTGNTTRIIVSEAARVGTAPAEPSHLVQSRQLVILGWRRWRVVSTNLFLSKACQQLLTLAARSDQPDSLNLSLIGTLSLFQKNQVPISLRYQDRHLHDILHEVITANSTVMLTPNRNRMVNAIEILQHMSSSGTFDSGTNAEFEIALRHILSAEPNLDFVNIPIHILGDISQSELTGLLLYLLCPDPLEVLVQQIVVLPPKSTSEEMLVQRTE